MIHKNILFSNNFVENRPIFIIIDIYIPEDICTVSHLNNVSTLPESHVLGRPYTRQRNVVNAFYKFEIEGTPKRIKNLETQQLTSVSKIK